MYNKLYLDEVLNILYTLQYFWIVFIFKDLMICIKNICVRPSFIHSE